jgi:hypothetical protein
VKRRGANFGDADFEPTDEQLVELSREAFAEVNDRHRDAMARLRAEVATLRQDVLARVAGVRPPRNEVR